MQLLKLADSAPGGDAMRLRLSKQLKTQITALVEGPLKQAVARIHQLVDSRQQQVLRSSPARARMAAP